MERLGGAIGYILGSIIIVPIIFALIDKYSISRNEFDVFKKQYLSEYGEFILELGPFEHDSISEGRLIATNVFTTKMAAVGGRDISSTSTMYYRKTRDNKTGKFFLISVVDGNRLVFSAIDDNRFVVRANKEDLINDQFGSSDNPIPVFSVRGIDKPLENYNRKGDIVQVDVSEEQYAYSAEMYWTYVATKDEFERRFGKQK